MILYKRNNLIFFFIIFLCLQKTSSQQNEENKNGMLEINKIPESKMKTDEIVENREKEISLIDENNKLKIKVEVYNIYLYFLIIINSLFFIGLMTYLIYKIVFKIKKNKSEDYEENDQLINDLSLDNDEDKIHERANNNANNDEYSINDDLLNNSGCEAPPVKGI